MRHQRRHSSLQGSQVRRKLRSWLRRGPFHHASAVAVAVVAVVVAGVAFASTGGSPTSGSGRTGAGRTIVGSVNDPISRSQDVKWGQRSFWLQPWRAYLDTWPGSRLKDAVGINFNVRPGEAASTARLLAANGFTRARVEIGWSEIDNKDPTALADPAKWRTVIDALHANGIRPLILLNANDNQPCPLQRLKVRLAVPARAGDKQVTLDSASAQSVVAGKTGLDEQSRAAGVIFTAVTPAGVATLSKPLPADMPAGSYPASTLKYLPFTPPMQADGSPNPQFDATMAGWLQYVDTTTKFVKGIVGSDDFDVEVWNELTFGSDFIDASNYYQPAPSGNGVVTDEILNRTVKWLRDPAHGVSGVQIGNGFANQRPWEAGSTSPSGLSAIDKHPYKNRAIFPHDNSPGAGIVPLDAQGQAAYNNQGAFPPLRVDKFVPKFTALLPEYFLTSTQTESLLRDISPNTSKVGQVDHGRNTAPPGGPAPTMWVTEFNMDLSGADPSNPASAGGPTGVTAAQSRQVMTKTTLRTLASFVSKGVSAVDFYAASGGNFQLIDQSFFSSIGQDGAGAYPGNSAGGATINAVGRLTAAFDGTSVTQPRPLKLDRIDDFEGRRQFDGNGTASFPPLYDRDVLAFFPFQTAQSRFVIPVYVMTRDVLHVYKPNAPTDDVKRFDMPEEPFRLTIGGAGIDRSAASATDPLDGSRVPVDVVARKNDQITVDMPVTDSPRLLVLQDDARAPTVRARARVVRAARVALSWRGSDQGSGVAYYRVERRAVVRGKSRWRVLLRKTKRQSLVLRGKPGARYQFRVRAVDLAGNRSPASVVKVSLPKGRSRTHG